MYTKSYFQGGLKHRRFEKLLKFKM